MKAMFFIISFLLVVSVIFFATRSKEIIKNIAFIRATLYLSLINFSELTTQ